MMDSVGSVMMDNVGRKDHKGFSKSNLQFIFYFLINKTKIIKPWCTNTDATWNVPLMFAGCLNIVGLSSP